MFKKMLKAEAELYKRAFDFKGRTSRSSYWYAVAFNVLLQFIVITPIFIISNKFGSFVFAIYAISIVIPGISSGVRRLHDINWSGLWILVPAISQITFFFKGTPGANRFGTPTDNNVQTKILHNNQKFYNSNNIPTPQTNLRSNSYSYGPEQNQPHHDINLNDKLSKLKQDHDKLYF